MARIVGYTVLVVAVVLIAASPVSAEDDSGPACPSTGCPCPGSGCPAKPTPKGDIGKTIDKNHTRAGHSSPKRESTATEKELLEKYRHRSTPPQSESKTIERAESEERNKADLGSSKAAKRVTPSPHK